MKEVLLSVDEFSKCKTLTGVDALIKLFINLLVVKPGTYPDNPTMGINLKKYLFMNYEKVTIKLITNINSQVEQFLPDMNIFETKLIQSSGSNNKIIGIYVTFGYNGKDYDLILQSNEKKELNYKLNTLLTNKEE